MNIIGSNDKKTIIWVLLVEDSSFDVEIVKSVLSLDTRRKFNCIDTDRISGAEELLNKHKFDIMLLDLFLPDSEGIDTIQKARNLTPDMPIVILSATKDEQVAIYALKEGAQDFLVKGDTKLANLPRIISYAIERNYIEKELRQATKDAEEATKLKDKFVSLVAHDLKSPFVAILGLLSIISEDKENPINPLHRTMLDMVLESSKRQLNMINELLKLNRIQSGKVILEKRFFDGHIIARSSLLSLKQLADEKGIMITNEIPQGTRLFADSNLYTEVLHNITSNAIKFCNKDDTITLSVMPDDKTTVVVKDTGVGMPESIIPNLFKHEIKTSTAGTKGEKGTGLGLPFSKEIITMHNGELSVESEMGKGTSFYIKLPVVIPRVLIVDNDINSCSKIRETLKELAIDCIEVENGQKAVDFLKKNETHLILSELEIPIIDGFQLLEYVKNKHETKSIPVIVVTMNKDLETRNRVFQMGANDFVIKDFTREELIPRVQRYIS